MILRLAFLTSALALTIACDPTTPSGPVVDPDTEADTDADTTPRDASAIPCPQFWDTEFPPLQIDAWTYNGEAVLKASPDCCDQFSDLRSADTCEYICAPDGGFTGQGDMRCTDFFDTAVHVETVWVNPNP